MLEPFCNAFCSFLRGGLGSNRQPFGSIWSQQRSWMLERSTNQCGWYDLYIMNLLWLMITSMHLGYLYGKVKHLINPSAFHFGAPTSINDGNSKIINQACPEFDRKQKSWLNRYASPNEKSSQLSNLIRLKAKVVVTVKVDWKLTTLVDALIETLHWFMQVVMKILLKLWSSWSIEKLCVPVHDV